MSFIINMVSKYASVLFYTAFYLITLTIVTKYISRTKGNNLLSFHFVPLKLSTMLV